MITVMVNESPMEIAEEATIHSLLPKMNANTDGIAVAINNSIVPRKEWEHHSIKQNDNILIIKATQGG